MSKEVTVEDMSWKAITDVWFVAFTDQAKTLERIATTLDGFVSKNWVSRDEYVELSNQRVNLSNEMKKRDAQIETLTHRLDKASQVFTAMSKRVAALEDRLTPVEEVPQ